MKNKLQRSVTDDHGTLWFIQAGGTRQRAKIKACATCRERFADYPSSTSIHCSKECYRKNCRRCGEKFKPRTNREIYCSYECKLGSAHCENCGIVFFPSKGSAGRFCSAACHYDMACPVGSVIDYSNGYKLIKVAPNTPGARNYGCRANWMLEHRFVMQQVLGRPLERTESVHHKNGRRDDNRPENLELWKRAQPAGIRSADYHCPGCRCYEP